MLYLSMAAKFAANEQKYKRAAMRAAQIVRRAVVDGSLPSLKEINVLCVDCKGKRAVHYEHRDYGKPLEVDPVCQGCNLRRGPALLSTMPKPMVSARSLKTFAKLRLTEEKPKAITGPMTDHKIRQILAAYIIKQHGHKQAATTLGISQGYLSDILSGRRIVPDSVLNHLNMERISGVRYKKRAVSR
jgi:hypothetical protein